MFGGHNVTVCALSFWLLRGKAQVFALTQSHIFTNKSLKNLPYMSW